MYDYHWQMHPLQVMGQTVANHKATGVVQLAPSWSAGKGVQTAQQEMSLT